MDEHGSQGIGRRMTRRIEEPEDSFILPFVLLAFLLALAGTPCQSISLPYVGVCVRITCARAAWYLLHRPTAHGCKVPSAGLLKRFQGTQGKARGQRTEIKQNDLVEP
jgi:hypothetical protein